jgi:DNA-directed RNA polymerase subunit RPC12/RpoP
MPYDDMRPPIEPLGSIERVLRNAIRQHQSIMNSFTVKEWEKIKEWDREARQQWAREREENGEPPLGECCDECGKRLENDSHEIKHGLLAPEEYLCDDCYRKRYGPYKCRKCGEEFSSGEIDWQESDKEEDSYICSKCSWKERYGDDDEYDHDDEPASW